MAGMWRALFYFLKLAILVGVAFWLAERPGELSLTWHGYRIETSVGVLLLAVYLAVLIGASFYYIWRQLRRVPFLASDSIQLGRKRRGYKALTQGMVAVAAGDAEEARRMARKAEVLLDEPPLTMLLQAQAAQLGGDAAAAKRYFKAMLDRDETRFMGLRGLLMQALRDGDQALALDYLEQARKIRPDAHWVINGLLDLQLQRGDLAGAQDSVTRARKARALPPAEASRRRAVLLVAQAQEAQAAGDNQRALKHLREAGKLTEDLLPGTLLEAELLLAEGKDRAAAKLAERAWPKALHPRLAELYLRALGEGKGVAGLKAIVRLTETAPEDRESLLARARAALDARLWGEARRYLAAAQDVGPGEAICRLMAKLEDSEHGDVAAARNWLDKATQAPAEPAWVCGTCGTTSPEWSATCAACKSFDSIAWRRPPSVAAPVLADPQAAAEAPPPPASGTTGPTIDALPAQSRRIEGG